MAIVDGLRANAVNTNARLMSRTTDTSTIGRVDLENTLPASGPDVDNVQREVNSLNAFTGRPSASDFDAVPVWLSNELGTTLDTLKARIEAIDGEFADLSPYVQDATEFESGLVNITTQTFAGDKTFVGSIVAANLTGTNSGDVTLGAIGATPNANGASLSGQVLNLQPADGTFGGVLTAVAQTFAGLKTFAAGLVSQVSLLISGVLNLDTTTDAATTGSLQTLTTPTKTIVRVTNAGLVSIEGVTAPTTKQQFVLMNVTGVAIDLVHLSGTAANQIHTGSGADLTMEDGQAVTLLYDLDSTVWRVIGGGGGGGTGASFLLANFTTSALAIASEEQFQVYSYTGSSPDTLVSFGFGFLPQGARLIVRGTSDTNSLTIDPSVLSNVYMNGTATLGAEGTIEFCRIGGGITEVSRNGF